MSELWIEVLREACAKRSQVAVARQLGYSAPVVNQVLLGTYAGALDRVQAAVEGALMNASVDCPVLGDISRAACIAWQRKPFTPTNPLNVRMYAACRACPHSFLPQSAPDITQAAAQPAVAQNTGSRGAVHRARVVTNASDTSHGVTRPTDRRKRSTHSSTRVKG